MEKWEALLRGQVVSTTTQKFFNYIRLADQKAQGLIFLNTILVPVTLNFVMNGEFSNAALISLVTSALTILAAIICIYPKRRGGRKPDGTTNLLHFGDIGRMKEEEFLEEFLPVFNNSSSLAELAVKDIHDAARRIILPKFKWLKIAYSIFFVGNVLAVLVFLFDLPL